MSSQIKRGGGDYYDKYVKYKKKYTDSKLHEQKGGAVSDRVYFMDRERLLAYINSYHGQLAENIYKEPEYIDAIEILKNLTNFYFPSETNPTTPQPKPPTEIPDTVKQQLGKNGDVAVLNADGTIDTDSTKQVINNIESSKLVKANKTKEQQQAVTQTVRNEILEDAIKNVQVTELSTELAEENSEYIQKSWWSRAWDGFIWGVKLIIEGIGMFVCGVWDGSKWVSKYVTYGVAWLGIQFGAAAVNVLITIGAGLRQIFKVLNPTRVFNPISDFEKEYENKVYEIVKNTVWFGEDNCVKLITPDMIQRCALQIKDYGINVTGRDKEKIKDHPHKKTTNQEEYENVKSKFAWYKGLPDFIKVSLYDETLYDSTPTKTKINTLNEYITYKYEITNSNHEKDIDKYTFDDNIGNIRNDTSAQSKASNLQRLVVNKSICALLSIQNAIDDTTTKEKSTKEKSKLTLEDRKKIKYAVYIDVDPSGRNANVIKWIIKLNEFNSCSVMIGPQFRGYNGKITTNYDTNYDSTHWRFNSILDGLSYQHLHTWNESAIAFINTVDTK